VPAASPAADVSPLWPVKAGSGAVRVVLAPEPGAAVPPAAVVLVPVVGDVGDVVPVVDGCGEGAVRAVTVARVVAVVGASAEFDTLTVFVPPPQPASSAPANTPSTGAHRVAPGARPPAVGPSASLRRSALLSRLVRLIASLFRDCSRTSSAKHRCVAGVALHGRFRGP
jgi:hypothetical protein